MSRAFSPIRGLGALAMAAAAILAPGRAAAQRAGENLVTSADDAFGSAYGQEKIGLYTDDDVRGFSPLKAGNMRIEGVYYDQIAALNSRARTGSVIRVGIAAVDFPFPAPTGIVDYRLRPAGDKWVVSGAFVRQSYEGYSLELDVQAPLAPGRFTLAGGLNYDHQEKVDGASVEFVALGLVPRLYLDAGDITPMISIYTTRHGDARPVVAAAGPYLPPLPEARRYLGQSWSEQKANNTNIGGSTRMRLGEAWSMRAGLYLSQFDKFENFSEVFTITDPTGRGTHRVDADPRQVSRSLAGEVQLFWDGGDRRLRHRAIFMIRGRDRLNESGGSATLQLGPVVLGNPDPEPQPTFAFGAVNEGRIKQITGAAGYVGRLDGVGQVNIGLQRTDYRQRYARAGVTTATTDRPWLLNGAIVATPRKWMTLYATYVRGLEETGVAPETAIGNRNEQLPASLTTQIDGGVRFSHGASRLVIGAFQIRKPYYSFDATNRYVELGDVTHRGIEVSYAGDIAGRLKLLAGAVLMDPVVTGEARALGRVGKRPVGTTRALARIDADYRTPIEGLSINAAAIHNAARTASARSYAELGGRQLEIPAFSTIDVGARYRFKVRDVQMSARVQISNLFDKRNWKILAANSYQMNDIRRAAFYLVADF